MEPGCLISSGGTHRIELLVGTQVTIAVEWKRTGTPGRSTAIVPSSVADICFPYVKMMYIFFI